MKRSHHAFTLAELLVSVTTLALLTLIVSRVVNSAATIAILGHKRLDAQSQVRPVLTRLTVDLAQMVRRPDVDYYRKDSLLPEIGNDQLTFFCNGPGYYPSSGSQSPLSLVSYRINANSSSSALNRMERMSKGLLWNGVTGPDTPMLFGLQMIAANWPAAISSNSSDPDYELLGPQIFRFEYYYVLKTGNISSEPGTNGWQDVTAIVVALAAIDQKSRALLSNARLTDLGGRLKDFDSTKPSYDLVSSWQETLDNVNDMPRPAINGVRIYRRCFYLNPLK